MDNQDKIFNKFKEAAENAETKDFPGMEKVWSRLEDKLDKKEDKKTIALWKKIAVAASLLLLISLGTQFLRSDKTSNTEINNSVVTIGDKHDPNKNLYVEENNEVVSSNSQLVPKTEAVKILEDQVKNQQTVTMHDTVNTIKALAIPMPSMAVDQSAPGAAPSKDNAISYEEPAVAKEETVTDFGYGRSVQRESAKRAYAAQSMERAKKSVPLVILNGNAMAHSDDKKRDKMMQAELPNLQPENVESLVVLDEPLYIIDGIYYSENDLFGANPTSPYAPLNQQEIKTITVLQDLEATAKYGEKGRNGVVIITTKTGKPTPKK